LLLVTQNADEQAGKAILGDGMSMHFNILSEPTAHYLETVIDRWKLELDLQVIPSNL